MLMLVSWRRKNRPPTTRIRPANSPRGSRQTCVEMAQFLGARTVLRGDGETAELLHRAFDLTVEAGDH